MVVVLITFLSVSPLLPAAQAQLIPPTKNFALDSFSSCQLLGGTAAVNLAFTLQCSLSGFSIPSGYLLIVDSGWALVLSGNTNNNGALYLIDGALGNLGTIDNHGTIVDDGLLVNNGAATVNNYNIITNYALMINTGTINNKLRATIANYGLIENAGFVFNDGTITDNCAGFTSITGGIPVMQVSACTEVSPNPGTIIIGSKLTSTATVFDLEVQSPPTGMVTWADGSAGGGFSASGVCTLSPSSVPRASACSLIYTPPSTPGLVTITASYSGDSIHPPSSGLSYVLVQTPSQAGNTLGGQVQILGPPGGPLNSGQVNSLIAKLNNAVAKLNSGATRVGCNLLLSFINEVQSLISNGLLTPQQGDPLISQAEAIRAAVPC